MITETSQSLNASGIENELKASFERSLCTGSSSADFLEDYFFSVDVSDESDLLSLARSASLKENEEKKRVLLSNIGKDWDARRDGFADVAQQENVPYPPLTNRGVTKYLNQNSNESQLCTDSKFAANTEYIVGVTQDNKPEGRWGGFDGGVEVGFEVQWDKEQFSAHLEVLAEGRQQAEGNDEKNPVYLNLGDYYFAIKPSGAKAGLYYKFVLEGCGVKVYLHHDPPKNRQGIRIRYQFESLIRFDLYSLHAKLREWLESLGLTIIKETVSRVDMQVMTLRKTHDYLKLIVNDHAITRAQKDVFYRKYKRLETYTIGSDIELCIYDKLSELADKGNVEKAALMKKYVFDCAGGVGDGSGLTRIEFRLRRDALRPLGINTIDDLYRKETALVDWLTSHWFRILDKPKVRGHENTAAIHPLWVEVQELFQHYFPGSDKERESIVWSHDDSVRCEPEALEKQAAGCLASAVALRYGGQTTPEDLRAILLQEIDAYLIRIFNRTNERATERYVRDGITAESEQEQQRRQKQNLENAA
ncbi:MAG: hypothetical protein LBI18_14040 [Planctomycetaceae bacterium]|jgi:hypothetical protein|nr:hypothetical protein [Planctomycetaceae bacterium]